MSSNSKNSFEIVIKERIELVQKIANILLPLNIHYVVGGSMASSLWGENRSPRDLDLVIDLDVQTAQKLVDAMSFDATSGQFYIISASPVETIVKSKAASEISFLTVIYRPPRSMVDIAVMVDIFVMNSDDPFLVSVMNRRHFYPVNGSTEEGIYIYSPEDIILQKLNWYTSPSTHQKHWTDVLEVLKVQKDQLDLAYLYRWALKLEVADLLIQAMFQSGY